jgi:hypothetical protein
VSYKKLEALGGQAPAGGKNRQPLGHSNSVVVSYI